MVNMSVWGNVATTHLGMFVTDWESTLRHSMGTDVQRVSKGHAALI